MKLKSKLISGIIACACLISTPSFAESGLYLGGSVGHSKVGYEPSENTSVDLDDSDIGYKLFGGFKFTLLAIEAGYVDFGKIEGDAGDVEISGFDAFGVLSLGLGPVEVFGKLGGFVWDSDYHSVGGTYKDDGFDPAFGVGAAFNLGSIGFRAEYEYFDIDDFDEVSMISLGATFWFL